MTNNPRGGGPVQSGTTGATVTASAARVVPASAPSLLVARSELEHAKDDAARFAAERDQALAEVERLRLSLRTMTALARGMMKAIGQHPDVNALFREAWDVTADEVGLPPVGRRK